MDLQRGRHRFLESCLGPRYGRRPKPRVTGLFQRSPSMAAERRRLAAGAAVVRVEVARGLTIRFSEAGLDTLPHAGVPVPVTSIKIKQIPLLFLLSLCASATAW